MDAGIAVQRLFRVEIRRLVFLIIGFLVVVILVSQCFSDPYGKKLYVSLFDNNGSNSTMKIVNSGSSLINTSKSTDIQVVFSVSDALDSEDDVESESEPEVGNNSDEKTVHENAEPGLILNSGNVSSRTKASRFGPSPVAQSERVVSESNEINSAGVLSGALQGTLPEGSRNLSAADFEGHFSQSSQAKYEAKTLKKKPTTVSEMYSLVLRSSVSSVSMKPRWSSARDRDLSLAKREIEKAPIIRNSRELSTLIFRNVSKFTRSYELMERVLKVYIYKEGNKPVFHQPYMRGIYASEGWFMKLMEANRKFVVRDPKKAHLFYLPFSSKALRYTLLEKESKDKRILEKQLKRYVNLISRRYRFWNRTDGADHFLVACHDWATYLTRNTMKNCIRSLCNTNVAKGFKIGKDTGFPVTYVRSAADPLENIGGKPTSERSTLAFFAGGLHGYLRPILLRYWGENREPDMKISGPMPRDPEGKRAYREYMKTSKYCVCARGYEVHTPRIVESIFYECVPVIVSDNYVPPFFEVLDWEAFSVFVPETDVPSLRDILLSISDERYESLRNGVKMVQKHFFWHREPVKYDLFHMTLHSIWNNRLLQVKTR